MEACAECTSLQWANYGHHIQTDNELLLRRRNRRTLDPSQGSLQRHAIVGDFQTVHAAVADCPAWFK